MKPGLIALLLLLSACSTPPEQPDLNTYGAIQPLCLFWCQIRTVLTDGGGSQGDLSTTINTTEQRSAP